MIRYDMISCCHFSKEEREGKGGLLFLVGRLRTDYSLSVSGTPSFERDSLAWVCRGLSCTWQEWDPSTRFLRSDWTHSQWKRLLPRGRQLYGLGLARDCTSPPSAVSTPNWSPPISTLLWIHFSQLLWKWSSERRGLSESWPHGGATKYC